MRDQQEAVRSYADAFYEVARMLGMNARSDTPENVWRNEMQPLLAARLSPPPVPAERVGKRKPRLVVGCNSIQAKRDARYGIRNECGVGDGGHSICPQATVALLGVRESSLATAPAEQPGEVALRKLSDAATPGEWMLQDGCSWRRIGTHAGDGDVLCPMNQRDGHPDLVAQDGKTYANLRFIIAAVAYVRAALGTNGAGRA